MDTRVVNAAGDLRDTRELRVFHRCCEEALNPARRRVVVDLARVISADTKLVATLVILLRRAQSVGVPIELTVSRRVYDWITLCRVERLLQPTCVQRACDAPQSSGGPSAAPAAQGDARRPRTGPSIPESVREMLSQSQPDQPDGLRLP